jgi:hypothetical protein
MEVDEATGWRSEATLHKAKQELLALGLIAETRKGARPNKASLYGVTWAELDECDGKLDISPQAFPRGAYLRRNVVTATGTNENLTTRGAVGKNAQTPCLTDADDSY